MRRNGRRHGIPAKWKRESSVDRAATHRGPDYTSIVPAVGLEAGYLDFPVMANDEIRIRSTRYSYNKVQTSSTTRANMMTVYTNQTIIRLTRGRESCGRAEDADPAGIKI